jgi:type III pantothenate kinase
MVLTIDLGNSHIVAGVFKNRQLCGVWRLVTDQSKNPDEYGAFFSSHLAELGIKGNKISGCIMSSVVPRMTPTIEHMVESLFHQPLAVVSSDYPLGLTLRYDHPDEIGTDRLVNAAAGFDRYHCDLIIVDFGTATTFCVITENGEYLGGVIAPGLKSAADSLFHQTAKLPMVDLVQPKTVIGTNTVSGMQSGLIFGHAGMVDELVTRIRSEIGQKAFVLATGGLASVIAPISRTIQEIRPNLTLEGLELLYRRMHLSCG